MVAFNGLGSLGTATIRCGRFNGCPHLALRFYIFAPIDEHGHSAGCLKLTLSDADKTAVPPKYTIKVGFRKRMVEILCWKMDHLAEPAVALALCSSPPCPASFYSGFLQL
jgi:hypothetical protein